MDISVVLPVYNEEMSIYKLVEEICEILRKMNKKFEVIMVNDGSSDNTQQILEQIEQNFSEVKSFQLRKNYGQTQATACGIDHSQGEVVIIMDSDGQNSPQDFSNLLEKIDEGFDMVAGYRKNRKDNFLRVFFSKCANFMVKKVSRVEIIDLGCSIKAYKKEYLKSFRLYGEMHRFLPIHIAWSGAKYTNIPVQHFHRKHGSSHYGFSRIFKVLADLWYLRFARQNFTKPIYFFGKLSCLSIFSCLVSLIIYFFKAFSEDDFLNFYLPFSMLFVVLTLCLISIGILGEVLVRTYFESQNKTAYDLKEK